MPRIRLGKDWSRLMERYEADHQNRINRACHQVGIPLIAGALPVGATIVGLPPAAARFTTGWAFQLVGHAFEGKKPTSVDDKRALIVGLLWWLKKAGLDIV